MRGVLRRHRRKAQYLAFAGADMFKTQAGKLEANLRRQPSAQDFVEEGIGRRRMADHSEAAGRRRVVLRLGVDRSLAPPPPGAVDKWPMRRVHQSDHRMIHFTGEKLRLDKARR